MTEAEHRVLVEILKAAEACSRLSQWEEEFCDDMRGRVLTRGAALSVSDKQWQVIRRIEGKVYA